MYPTRERERTFPGDRPVSLITELVVLLMMAAGMAALAVPILL